MPQSAPIQPSQAAAQAAQVIQAGNAPAQSLSNLTVEQLLQSIGLTVPGLQESNAYSQLGLQQGLGQAAISEEQLGVQGQGLAAQLGLAEGQQGLEAQQFTNTMTSFPEQQAEATEQYKTNQQQLQGSLAASGTLNTGGSKLQQGNLADQYAWQQEDIARSAANAQIGQQSEQMGYQYGLGDIARSQTNLGLASQANGLSVQQLLSQWQQGMQQNGINANPEQAYLQYLTGQGAGIAGIGGVAGQEGLLTPGGLANAGLAGGVNLNSLFAGAP